MPNYQNGKIYKIVNDINEKIYIGSTSLELSTRMALHREDTKKKNTPFYKKIREIGVEYFKIILIKNFPCSSKAELNAEEYRVMKEMKQEGVLLYNIMIERHCPMLGKTLTEEHKQKIGDAHRGKIVSEESKQKISQSKKGKTFTEEHKQKMSESKKGENHPRFNYGNTCYDTSNKAWIFQWKDSGKRKVKTFSLKRFGDFAKLHAEEYRKVIYPESVDETQCVEIIFVD